VLLRLKHYKVTLYKFGYSNSNQLLIKFICHNANSTKIHLWTQVWNSCK